jgi:hypothetical protein
MGRAARAGDWVGFGIALARRLRHEGLATPNSAMQKRCVDVCQGLKRSPGMFDAVSRSV